MMFLIEKALALLPSVKFVAENVVPLEGLLSHMSMQGLLSHISMSENVVPLEGLLSHMSMQVNLLEN